MSANPAWRVDPLHWGHGPQTFEVFLEPTCPFSGRAFAKFDSFVDLAGADRVTLKIILQSQPWHLFSGIICRAILAASTTPRGREAAKAVMAAVFEDRESYEFENHATGPNRSETPDGLLARISQASDVDLAAAFDNPSLDREIKWHCKYARQNGIHVSPTFMVNGLVVPTLGSGDDVSNWVKHLS